MENQVIQRICTEAENIMKLYSRPARDAIELGLYGPREAQFAALVLHLYSVVIVQNNTGTTTTPVPTLDSYDSKLLDQINMLKNNIRLLIKHLDQASNIIEASISGQADIVEVFQGTIKSINGSMGKEL